MVLSNVHQIDEHLGDSRELGSIKTKQYMTETTTESNGTAKTNRDCTQGQQSQSKGAPQKQLRGPEDMQKDERRRLAVGTTRASNQEKGAIKRHKMDCGQTRTTNLIEN